jgi:hypothetical protein
MKFFKKKQQSEYVSKIKVTKKSNIKYISKLGKGTSKIENGVVQKKGVKKSFIQRCRNIGRSLINKLRFKKKDKIYDTKTLYK